MKRIIIGIVIGVAITAAGTAVASVYGTIYNKGGIRCLDVNSGGIKTVGCALSNGTGYYVGINKYLVAVTDSRSGKMIFKRLQP